MADKSQRRRFQFSLRTLFVIITILSVGPLPLVWWLRTQMEGQLVEEEGIGPRPKTILLFFCANTNDAKGLADHFEREAFRESCEKSLANSGLNTPIEVYHGADLNIFFVKYDFNRWGRHHLDVRTFRYRFNLNDPVAEGRNAAIREVVAGVGRSYAGDHPVIVKYQPFP